MIYQESCVAFERQTRAVAWCLGCLCLLVVTLPEVAFSAAIVVRGNLDFNGNGIMVDSFDSSDPTKSTNGQYDSAKAGDNGDIYAGQNFLNAVNIGNADVFGTVYIGGGAYSIGASGAVGTLAWQASGGSGFEPGFLSTTNFVLTDVTVPSGLQYITPVPGQVVTQGGPPTSQTLTAQPNLPTLDTNQSFTSITTNFSSIVTTAIYPGPVPGLTTNTTIIVTNSYPGDMPDLETNCVSFVTVTDDPGSQPCLTSNDVVTTSDYPGPVPGLVTNIIITPPCITAITNDGGCSDLVTSSTLPNSWCASNGIQTNCGTAVTNASAPAPGTWCLSEGIITNVIAPLKRVVCVYYPIVGYTYTTNVQTVTYLTNNDCPSTTNVTYTYPAGGFTYANQINYTYQFLTYTYSPVASYDYTIYSAWTYQTNSYDAVLSNGCYFAASLGDTIVTGPSTLVLPSKFPIANLTIAAGGALTVYVESGPCYINALGVTNATGVASNLVILCTPAVSIVTLGAPTSFVGIVDAPEATAAITVPGNAFFDFSGTLIVNSLSVSGDFRMHCDESLGQWGYLLFPSAPSSPRLSSPFMWNGLFSFIVSGTYGDQCVVESSTDLINWNPVFTNSGLFEFTDTNAMNQSQNFYRTIYVQ